MFKKRQKKDKTVLLENLEDEVKNEEKEDLEKTQNENQQKENNSQNQQSQDIIKKGRKKQFLTGIDPKKLIEIQSNDETANTQLQKNGGNVVDQIESRYYKESKSENQDKLMDTYVKQKLQEKLTQKQLEQQQNLNQNEKQIEANENFQEKEIEQNEGKSKSLKEQIQEMKEQIDQQEKTDTEQQLGQLEPKQDNFISQAISTTWTNGIMEVRTSLEQKAENLAKMAEFQRKQLLKGIVDEETYQQKIKREKQEYEKKKNEEKKKKSLKDKELQSFMKQFNKEGRVYKSKQYQNSQYNKNIEQY